MKRLWMAGCALACGTVLGQTPPGLGRNMAGLIRTEVPTNGYAMAMASVPFQGFDPSGGAGQAGSTSSPPGRARTIGEVIGDQLTGSDGVIAGSDIVFWWDPAAQTYLRFWKANNNGNPQWREVERPFTLATNTLQPGQGFFIKNNQTNIQYFSAYGEVPSQSTLPTSSVALVHEFTQVAYSYPTEIALNSTALSNAVSGEEFSDFVLPWNAAQQVFDLYLYDQGDLFGAPGWYGFDNLNEPTAHTLKPGQAFIYRLGTNAPGSVVWTEVKPYTWP